LGASYYSLNKFQDAVFYFQKVIDLDPSYAEAYTSLGIACYSLGKIDDAKQYLQKAKDLFRARGDSQSIEQIEKYLEKIIR
jgi:tetratricopeptide (TPR) repeat protein